MLISKRKNRPRPLKERMIRNCVACGKEIKIYLYIDRSYRGGHFFKFGDSIYYDKRRKLEFWECANCYYRH